MNKWSQSSRALPEQAEQLYGINVWFISAGEKHVLHCGNIKAQSERAWRSSVSLRVAYKHLFSKGHLWRAHCTDVLPAICHVLAYSSSMKRSCENKQQLTRCHIWQWSRSPRGVSANPFLSQREKGEFFTDVRNQNKSRQRWRRLTNPASIPLQPLSFLYIMQETSFLLDRSQAHICRCTNVSPGSFSIHAWDDFPLAPLLEALKHFPLSATDRSPWTLRATPARAVLCLASRTLWKWQSPQR